MKKLFIALLIGIGIYAYVQSNPVVISSFTSKSVQNNQVITDAYQNRLSDIQVSGSGMITKAVVIKGLSYDYPLVKLY